MKLARVGVIAAAVLAVATLAWAQKPDFSGTWTLDPAASDAPAGGGEPLFGVAPVIPYPEIFATVLPLEAGEWYDADTGALLFPFKSLAAATGLVLLPSVSRLAHHLQRMGRR